MENNKTHFVHSVKMLNIVLIAIVFVTLIYAYILSGGCEFIHIQKPTNGMTTEIVFSSLLAGFAGALYTVPTIWLIASITVNTIQANKTIKEAKEEAQEW